MGKFGDLFLGTVLALGQKGKADPSFWLFSSNENVHFDSNARYLFEYVRENCPQIHPRFVINDEALREKLSKEWGEEYFLETLSKEGKKKALEAGAWFTSAGVPMYGMGLGRGRCIINLWHGLPLKRIALADPNLSLASRLLFHWVFSKNYDRVVTGSTVFVPIMAEAFGVKEEQVAVWGQPRCDRLVEDKGTEKETEQTEVEQRKKEREEPKEKEQRIKEPRIKEQRIKEQKEKKILYAPTFRDDAPTRIFPFADYDMQGLDAWLEEKGAVIYVRLHHLDQTDPTAFLSERVKILGTQEVEDVTGSLPMFDALVTDYSSIYIDYLLCDRGMIFLPYDKEEYLKGRGMYFDYEKVTPGPKPESMEEFFVALEDILKGEDSFSEERHRVRDFFHEVQSPCCARIVEEVQERLKARGLSPKE